MGQLREVGTSIRSQLTRIVLIPSVTFLVLFAVLSATTLVQAVSLKIAAVDGQVAVDLYRIEVELQIERRLAVEYLGALDQGDHAEALDTYRAQTTATDDALDGVLERAQGLAGRGAPRIREHAREFLDGLEARGDLRSGVLEGELDRDEALTRYTGIAEAGHRLFDTTGRALQDGDSVAEGVLTLELVRVQELLARADALLSGAAASGALTTEEQSVFAGLMERARGGLFDTTHNMAGELRSRHQEMVGSSEWARMNALAQEVAARDTTVRVDALGGEEEPDEAVPVDIEEWRSVTDAVAGELVGMSELQWDDLLMTADTAGNHQLTWAIGGGIIAFFAGALAFGVASRSSHRLIRRLLRLRSDTLNLAQKDLPRIIGRLERGETVNPDDDVQPLDYGTDEIGQVASAFNTAQRTAVAAAVRQAEIREGANRVFLGIAHRNQSLVQRQLQLLDRIERQEDDPDLLEELFHLDHLATRGRRHAENLIILGKGKPGRRWRDPIPLTDILRGAISETEEYARVKLRQVPDLSLAGAVVADVIHLVAELVENATAFSPPHTMVHIYSEVVPRGVVVEVEDRGLGMAEEDLEAANRTLAKAPEFDVMALNEDSRLGLFVVARLAAKHNISVQLRGSPYGGTRAIILIPSSLVERSAAGMRPAPAAPLPPAETANRNGSAGPGDLLAPLVRPELADESGQHTQPRKSTSADNQPGRGTLPYNGTGPPSGGEAEPGVGESAGETPPAAEGREGHQPSLPARRSPAASDSERGGERPQLPKRQRQASLAPQLRRDVPEENPEEAGLAETARSAEDIRRTMSALQSGTRRGRDSGEDAGTDASASEGVESSMLLAGGADASAAQGARSVSAAGSTDAEAAAGGRAVHANRLEESG